MTPKGRARLFRFEMASARAAVPRTVERILESVAGAGLAESQTSNLAIALSEALANAAIHGNQLDANRSVTISVRTAVGEATIDIRDGGRGFDHSGVRDPTNEAHVLMPGGRGVFLMRHLVDSLEYNRSGNRVRLVVRARAD
jgi:anti-sigma regulatory factor (Ser/Thr protein kinase)